MVGISETAYVPATPRCLDWRHALQRTGTNSGPPHPIAGVLVLLGRPNDGDYDLWVRTGRGRLVPRDGAWQRRRCVTPGQLSPTQPDSVADYTLMLMLMAVRHAKSVIRRAEVHDYRLNDVRGKELRDLTIGVIGTGRIGAAVMDRLRGFGCRVLAYDNRPRNSADYVPLD